MKILLFIISLLISLSANAQLTDGSRYDTSYYEGESNQPFQARTKELDRKKFINYLDSNVEGWLRANNYSGKDYINFYEKYSHVIKCIKSGKINKIDYDRSMCIPGYDTNNKKERKQFGLVLYYINEAVDAIIKNDL